MNIANYSSDSRAVIKIAREIASEFRHPEIDVEHLFLAVVRQEGTEVESILNQLGKSPKFVESVIEQYLKDQSSQSTARENLAIGPAVQDILMQAIEEKGKLYDALVEPEHIFIAILDPKTKLSGYVREKVGLTKEDLYKAIAESKSVQEITTATPSAGAKPESAAAKDVAGTLRYCVDMTNLAAAGDFDPMIGRENELQQVIQVLLRRRKSSPILVGGAGVGKSAIIEGLAQAVIEERVPRALHGIKVMEVDMGSMVAGAKYKGEFEERFKSLVSEAIKTAGKIVLFIDEVHTITGAGSGSGGMDAANLLKPALARGQIRLIGATTEEEYTKHLEKDKALARRFEKVLVEQPVYDDAVRIVSGVISKYADHHKIAYTHSAVIGSIKYAQRYLSERNLPDIALDIIDEAGSEYAVKEEYAKEALPKLNQQLAEVSKLLSECDGKHPDKDGTAFKQLCSSYDELCRGVDRLQEFWGHRLQTAREVS
jgi:ATP-dependent Clp protease ATP-binding subunit ClpB